MGSARVIVRMLYLALSAIIAAESANQQAITEDSGLHLRTGAKRISPALEPVSPKHFDKDYPADKQAVVDETYVFNHPYPAVQDSNDFDKDFVKDENSDGGRWAAQMQY